MRACRVLAVLVSMTSASITDAQPRRPNIVVIVADDMGYADIGVHGSKDIPTPSVDALARGGVRFTDGYVSGPFCGPTRAGLLTGLYPQRFGQEFNISLVSAHRDVGLPLAQRTMADHLKAAGYRTALIGKWHLGTTPRFSPLRRGFDEFFGFLGGGHSYFNVGPDSNPLWDGNERVKSVGYLTDTLSARAVEFVRRNKAAPFFLYLAYNAVHTPLEASDKYLARFAHIADQQRRTYAAMLSAMDDGIGQVLAALREERLDGNTLIFFFSDNGGPVSAGGSPNGSSNVPLRGQKGQTYEGGIRVPFIVRWTGRVPAGRIDSRPVIQLDVLPTALAAAGVTVAPEQKFDGVNLLPFLTGAQAGAPHDALFWRLGGAMALRSGDWKLVKMYPGAGRDHPSQLTLAGAELFNLASDTSERNNLAAARPEKVAELSATWRRWNEQLAAPSWEPVAGYADAPRGCLDRSLPRPLSAYAGDWRGAFARSFPFSWSQGTDTAGTVTIGRDTTRVPARVLFASSDSVVVNVTESVRSGPAGGGAMVRMRFVAYVCEDELSGFLFITQPNGNVRRAPLSATRASPQSR
jgi:arylsulfatase A-like enzyme